MPENKAGMCQNLQSLQSPEESLFHICVSKKVLLWPAACCTEISQHFYDIPVALVIVTPALPWGLQIATKKARQTH